MPRYLVGASGLVERPWPAGAGESAAETRLVPEGQVHAVDPDTRLPLCGEGSTLVVLDTPWDELWRLSWVGGPERCSRCQSLSTPREVKRDILERLERYEASTTPTRPELLEEVKRRLRDELEEGS